MPFSWQVPSWLPTLAPFLVILLGLAVPEGRGGLGLKGLRGVRRGYGVQGMGGSGLGDVGVFGLTVQTCICAGSKTVRQSHSLFYLLILLQAWR